MSKGSKPRPIEVTAEAFSSNWDLIFGKKKEKPVPCTDIECPQKVTFSPYGCFKCEQPEFNAHIEEQ